MNNLRILQDNMEILNNINNLLSQIDIYEIYSILKKDINIKDKFFYGELEHFFDCSTEFDDIIKNLNDFAEYLTKQIKIIEIEYLKLLTPPNPAIMENELKTKGLKTINNLSNELIKNDYNYIMNSLNNINSDLLAYNINNDLLFIYKFDYNNYNSLCTYELSKVKKYKLKYANK